MGGPQAASPGPAYAAPTENTTAQHLSPRAVTTPDGRAVRLIDLGAAGGAAFLDRIAAEMPSAAGAVTGFWGAEWPDEITIVVAGSAEQFAALAGAGPDVAATTTAQRITFSPDAVAMSDPDLRTVLRHELFHYAARADTASDGPFWLAEGVADFVGRPPPPPAGIVDVTADAQLPTDAELGTAGPQRSAAYDRAWSFVSYVADVYGVDALRRLYRAAFGPGHADVATAVHAALGVDLADVLSGWRQWRPS